MLSVGLYLTQHDHEAAPGDCTPEIQANAEVLVDRVNRMLHDFGIVRVLRSGWRPPSYNATFQHFDAAGAVVRGGATHSTHMTGEGVDVADNDGLLDQWLTDERLAKYDLYREAPECTPSWCHLQTRTPHSGKRTYTP